MTLFAFLLFFFNLLFRLAPTTKLCNGDDCLCDDCVFVDVLVVSCVDELVEDVSCSLSITSWLLFTSGFVAP